MKRILLATVLAFTALPALAAPDYPALAAAEVRARLVDPMSVQRAERTPPFEYRMFGTHVAVCVAYYAKNRLGGYNGRSVWKVVFREKRGVIFLEATDDCDKYGWKPFPELNGE